MLEVFHQSFMRMGFLATALIGVSCGYLSVFVVLKRLVFLAVALAQLASASVALSFCFGFGAHGHEGGLVHMLAAFIGVLLGALLFSWPTLGRYLPRENAIGAAYALASAAGVLLIATNAQAESHLLNLLYGNVLTARPEEIWLMSAILAGVGTLFLLFHKELLFTSFDPEMAGTVGVRTRLWETLFYLSLGLVIAMAIRLGGMMLVFALLVLPGFAALLAGSRIRAACWLAPVLGVLAGIFGLYVSYYRDELPASAVTIVTLGLFLIPAALAGMLRRRGTRRPAPLNAAGRAFRSSNALDRGAGRQNCRPSDAPR
jgi:ABC-type Mn2+/Zn2+ transport system permease subunit